MDLAPGTPPHVAAPDAPSSGRGALIGNRLVLLGTLVYLCEFVGLAVSGAAHLPAYPGTSVATVVGDYAGRGAGLGFLVGWFALVQLGRIVVMVGIRRGLHDSGEPVPWMDVAVAAMAVGVVLEIAGEALAAAAGALSGPDQAAALVALDRAAWYLQSAVLAPTGVAILIAAFSMWRSGLFSRVLVGLGVVGGGMVLAAGVLTAPAQADLQDALTTGSFVVWIWLIWTGVTMWRRATPRPASLPAG